MAPSSLTFEFAPGLIVGFLLALVRASAWLAIAPPFNNKSIPPRVKAGLAITLAIVVAPKLNGQQVPLDTAGLVGAVALQVVVGLLLGFVAMLLLSAAQMAGGLIDLFGGFALNQAFDPMSANQASVFGRAYQLFAIVLLFAIDGHIMLVRGFLSSFNAVPAKGLHLSHLSTLLTHDLGLLFVSAIEIAAPLLAALFLADVALALVARAAPQLNPLMLGFPLKILLTLLLVGFALPLLPDAVSTLLHHAAESGVSVVRQLGG